MITNSRLGKSIPVTPATLFLLALGTVRSQEAIPPRKAGQSTSRPVQVQPSLGDNTASLS